MADAKAESTVFETTRQFLPINEERRRIKRLSAPKSSGVRTLGRLSSLLIGSRLHTRRRARPAVANYGLYGTGRQTGSASRQFPLSLARRRSLARFDDFISVRGFRVFLDV